ncbi:MAG: hypothetical protein R3E53_06280 [Myxococcota bacterium]
MRVLWQDDVATYHGRHVRFENVHAGRATRERSERPDPIGGSFGRRPTRGAPRRMAGIPTSSRPEDLAKGVETIGRAATEPVATRLGSSRSGLRATTSRVLRPRLRSYTDAGADRVITSNVESQTTDIGKQRDFIRRYQDEILAKLWTTPASGSQRAGRIGITPVSCSSGDSGR